MKKDEIIAKCKDCGTDIIVHKSRANQPTQCIYCKIKADRTMANVSNADLTGAVLLDANL